MGVTILERKKKKDLPEMWVTIFHGGGRRVEWAIDAIFVHKTLTPGDVHCGGRPGEKEGDWGQMQSGIK